MSVSSAVRRTADWFVQSEDAAVHRAVTGVIQMIDPSGRITARRGDKWAVNMDDRILIYKRTFGGRPLSEREYMYLTFHEGGHLLHTQNCPIPDWVAMPKAFHKLWNACEDMRMERCMMRQFPGFAAIRNKVGGRLLQEAGMSRMPGILKTQSPHDVAVATWLSAMKNEYEERWDNGRRQPEVDPWYFDYHLNTTACEDTHPLYRKAVESPNMQSMMQYVEAIYRYLFPDQDTEGDDSDEDEDTEGGEGEGEGGEGESTEGDDEQDGDDTEGDDEQESEGEGESEGEQDEQDEDGDTEGEGGSGEDDEDDDTEGDDKVAGGPEGDEDSDDDDTEGDGDQSDEGEDADEGESEAGESDDSDSDDPTEGDTEGDGDGESDDTEGEDSDGDDGEGEQDDSDAEGDGSGTDEDGTPEHDTDEPSEGDDEATEGEQDEPDTLEPVNIFDEDDEFNQPPDPDTEPVAEPGAWKTYVLGGSANQFATIMRSMLRKNNSRGKRRNVAFGNIDVQRAYRMDNPIYDYRVFTRRVDPNQPRYALIISVDTSGSMYEFMGGGRTQWQVALESAATLCEAWNQLRLPWTLFGWGSRVNYVVNDGSPGWQLDITTVRGDTGGGTDEHVAIFTALDLSMHYASQGFQPLWFHISDGDAQTTDQDRIDKFVDTFGKDHVYFIGVNTGGQRVGGKFPNFVEIRNASQLYTYMKTTIRRQVYNAVR